MCSRRRALQWVVRGRGACMAGGECMAGACVVGDVHGRGWGPSCMVGAGMHGRGHAWQGACMAGQHALHAHSPLRTPPVDRQTPVKT